MSGIVESMSVQWPLLHTRMSFAFQLETVYRASGLTDSFCFASLSFFTGRQQCFVHCTGGISQWHSCAALRPYELCQVSVCSGESTLLLTIHTVHLGNRKYFGRASDIVMIKQSIVNLDVKKVPELTIVTLC